MVKIQKPNPKTFKNNAKKVNKPNGIKKEKPLKDGKTISSSNVAVMKAKTKLIQKVVQENPTNIKKNVQTIKKETQTKAKANVKTIKKPSVAQESVHKGENKAKNVEKNANKTKGPVKPLIKVGPLIKKVGAKSAQPNAGTQVNQEQKKKAANVGNQNKSSAKEQAGGLVKKVSGQNQKKKAVTEGKVLKEKKQTVQNQIKEAGAVDKTATKKKQTVQNQIKEAGAADKTATKKKQTVQNQIKKAGAVDKTATKKKQTVQNQIKKAGAIDKTATKKKQPVHNLKKKAGLEDKTPMKKNIVGKNKIIKKSNVTEEQTAESVEENPITEKSDVTVPQFEAQPFDEDQFNAIVTAENIKKICQALKTLVEKQVSEKKSSIFSDFRYFLNVCSYKIPNCPKRIVKLNIEHSLVDPKEDDIVMIVPDLQRGAKVDYEPTIQHYEDLLREAGVTGIKIIPFNQLRRECTTFEAKRKFANSHDYFMCDGRIMGHAIGFCGKVFKTPRTTFHSLRLHNPKILKFEIERALKRTSYKQLQKGDLISIPVGSHRFNTEQLQDNILLVIKQLKTIFPGGLANIRNMHLKIDIKGTSALPLYVNLAGPPADTPSVIGLREQQMIKLKKQANEVLTQFNMSKSGEFVKLGRDEVERKRQIREARNALLSEAPVDETDDVTPAKKTKKDVGGEKLKIEDKSESIEEEGDDEGDSDGEEQNGTEVEDDDENESDVEDDEQNGTEVEDDDENESDVEDVEQNDTEVEDDDENESDVEDDEDDENDDDGDGEDDNDVEDEDVGDDDNEDDLEEDDEDEDDDDEDDDDEDEDD